MPVLPSYRNESIDLQSKSIDWFLYEGNTGIQWVKSPAINARSLDKFSLFLIDTICSSWYHLYNLKNVKSTHGGVLLLTLLKVTIFLGCFHVF